MSFNPTAVVLVDLTDGTVHLPPLGFDPLHPPRVPACGTALGFARLMVRLGDVAEVVVSSDKSVTMCRRCFPMRVAT